MITPYEKSLIRTYANSFLISQKAVQIPGEPFYTETIGKWVDLGYDEYEVAVIVQQCVETMMRQGFMIEDYSKPDRYLIIAVKINDGPLTKEEAIRRKQRLADVSGKHVNDIVKCPK